MNSELEIHFGANEDNYLSLRVDPTSSVYAIDFSAEVKSAGFYGGMEWHIQPQELADFEAELKILYRFLSGQAVLKTITGEWIGLVAKIDKFGMVILTGFLDKSLIGSATRLEFEIKGLDQSYLPAILAQIRAVLAVYHIDTRP